MTSFLIEALVVGVMTSVVGYMVSWVISRINGQVLPESNQTTFLMLISLFITGFLIHSICQVTGINAYYCKNGAACTL